MSVFSFITMSAAVMIVCLTPVSVAAAGDDDSVTTQTGVVPCSELPKGTLTQDELRKFAPDDSPGRVRIAWKTESQENTYGFNILRADSESGPYAAINKAIIPGEGTTNVPTGYCFEDTGVKRGQTYFYQIEEVTTLGEKTIVEGTAATLVKVKTVQEEREWLQKKAAETKSN